MNNDNNSIHDFDFNLICEYFSSMDRQGPGSNSTTLRALSFVDGLTEQSAIADLGCGTDMPTLTLAHHTPCRITALDLFPSFIDKLQSRCQQEGLQHRVNPMVGDMCQLPFSPESIDLIWCEGAIYNIGFKQGLHEWLQYLRPNGYIAVSDAVWLTNQRPTEIEQFWLDAYPEIDTIGAKLSTLQDEGYRPVAMFVLPEDCWTDHFYTPAVKAQEDFLSRHIDNPTAINLVANQRREAELYHRYHRHYGYAFFIAQKQ